VSKIYIVEDDDNIRELVIYALEAANFEAVGFEESSRFFQTLKTSSPDLILLDIMLPNEDGTSILKKLKNNPKTGELPVILLTAKAAELDRVKGLDAGADDYISKPFSVLELVSRIKAVLRRSVTKKADFSLAINQLVLYPDKRLVTSDGQKVSLTFKEFELLHLLMSHAGLVLSRDKILEAVWGIDFEGETRTVDMHIKTLRQKLGESGMYIHTVRGVGYKVGD